MSGEIGHIGVIEDDQVMGESLLQALELEGWRVSWWQTGKAALAGMAAADPDLVVCDIRLPDISGEEVFRAANSASLAPPFIFMTAFGEIDQAISLIRAGGYDYLSKPFDLEMLFQKARGIVAQRARVGAEGMLGASVQMKRIENLLRRVSTRQLPVLLTGETGSGKEVCARFLHQISPSANEPFMGVNCAAIPAELLESEVFGHEKGAFSGAHQRHLGYAERAKGGTLFLDEISEMPLSLQAKLLRLVEERGFQRVGGEAMIRLKARIVCATNCDLNQEIRRGRFREDLLYRINAITVEIPPLRERPEDISWLLPKFFAELEEESQADLRGISTLTEEAALAHSWPGNVRELRNRVERAIALSSGPWLMPADLFPEFKNALLRSVDPMLPLAAVRNAAEKQQIERALLETNGQMIEAAKRLGVSRTTLWEKMRRYGLSDSQSA